MWESLPQAPAESIWPSQIAKTSIWQRGLRVVRVGIGLALVIPASTLSQALTTIAIKA